MNSAVSGKVQAKKNLGRMSVQYRNVDVAYMSMGTNLAASPQARHGHRVREFGIIHDVGTQTGKDKKGESAMPRLLERDDVMRTAVDLGRAGEVWAEDCDSASGEVRFSLPSGGFYHVVVMRMSPLKVEKRAEKKTIPYGLLKEKLNGWSYEADRAMDDEICGMFDCLKENV